MKPHKQCRSICCLAAFLMAIAITNAAILHIDKKSVPDLDPLQAMSTYVIEYGPLYSPNSSEPEASVIYSVPPTATPASNLDPTSTVINIPSLKVKFPLTKYVVSIAPMPKLYPQKNYFVLSSPNPPSNLRVSRVWANEAQLQWTASQNDVVPADPAAIVSTSDIANNPENHVITYAVRYQMLPGFSNSYPKLVMQQESEAPVEAFDIIQQQFVAKSLLPGATYLANVSAVLTNNNDQRRIVSEPLSITWTMRPSPPTALREIALRTNESSLTVSWKEPAGFSFVDYYWVQLTDIRPQKSSLSRTLRVAATTVAGTTRTEPGFKIMTNTAISMQQQSQQLSATFDDLEPGTSYNVTVQAVVDRRTQQQQQQQRPAANNNNNAPADDNDTVQYSDPVSLQITTVPEPPAQLTRIPISINTAAAGNSKQARANDVSPSSTTNSNAVLLQWSPPSHGKADGYVVNVRPPLNSSQSIMVDQNERTARLLGIQQGSVYRIDVQSHSGPQPKNRFSKPLSLTIATGPPAPESVWFIPGATTTTSATIAWTTSAKKFNYSATTSSTLLEPQAEFYEVRVNSSSSSSSANSEQFSTSVVRRGSDEGAQTAIVKDLLPAHAYQVDVVAVARTPNSAGSGGGGAMQDPTTKPGGEEEQEAFERSAPASVIVRTKPMKPRGLSAEPLNITSVRLSWHAETDANGEPRRDILYQISVARAASPQNVISSYRYQPRALAAGRRASVNLSPLESDTQYVFEVRTVYADDLVSEAVTVEGGPAVNVDIQLIVANRPAPPLTVADSSNESSPPTTTTNTDVVLPYVTFLIKRLPSALLMQTRNDDKSVGDTPTLDPTTYDIVNNPLVVEYVGVDTAERGVANVTKLVATTLTDAEQQTNGSLGAIIGPLTPGALYKFHLRLAAAAAQPSSSSSSSNSHNTKDLYSTEHVMPPSVPLDLKVNVSENDDSPQVMLTWQPPLPMRPPSQSNTASAAVSDKRSASAIFDRYYVAYAAAAAAADAVGLLEFDSRKVEKYIDRKSGNNVDAVAELVVTDVAPGVTYMFRVYTESRGRRSLTFAEAQITTPPAMPQNLRIVAVENEKLLIEWRAAAAVGANNNNNISHYILEIENLNFTVSVAAPPSPPLQTAAAASRLHDSASSTAGEDDLSPLMRKSSSSSVSSTLTAAAAMDNNGNNLLRARRDAALQPSGGGGGGGHEQEHDAIGGGGLSDIFHRIHNVNNISQMPRSSLSMMSGRSGIINAYPPTSSAAGSSSRTTSVATAGMTSGGGGQHGQTKRQQRWTIPAASMSANGVYQRTLPIIPNSALCCKGATYLLSLKSVVGGTSELAKASRAATLTIQSLPPSIAIPQSNVQVLNTTAVEVHFKLTYPPQLSLFEAVLFRINSSSSSSSSSSSKLYQFSTQLMPDVDRSGYVPLENPVTLTGLVPGETYSLDGWTLVTNHQTNETSKSPASLPVNGVTLKPAAVENLRVADESAVTPTSVTVAWQAPSVYSIYQFYELVCNGTPSVVTLPKGRLSYTIDGLRPWTKYSITVVAVSSSNSASAVNNNGSSINSNFLGDSFSGDEKPTTNNNAAGDNKFSSLLQQDERIVAGVMSAAAGIGGQRSEPTTIMVETAEIAPGPLRSVSSRLINPRQLQVEWAAPELPNGRIENYALEYRGLQRDVLKRKRLYNMSTFGVVLDDLEPGEPYRLDVYATSRAGAGDPFVVNVPAMPIWDPPLSHVPTENKPQLQNRTTTTIAVTFSDSMFESTNGDILAYTIVVSEHSNSDDTTVSSSSLLPEGGAAVMLPGRSSAAADGATVPERTWYDVQNQSVWPAYQAAPLFNPFKADINTVAASSNFSRNNNSSSSALLQQRNSIIVKRAVSPANSDDIHHANHEQQQQQIRPKFSTFIVGSDSYCAGGVPVVDSKTSNDASANNAVIARSKRSSSSNNSGSNSKFILNGAADDASVEQQQQQHHLMPSSSSLPTRFVVSQRLLSPPPLPVAALPSANNRSDLFSAFRDAFKSTTFHERQLHALDAVAVVHQGGGGSGGGDEFTLSHPIDQQQYLLKASPPATHLRMMQPNNNDFHRQHNDTPSFFDGKPWPAALKARISDTVFADSVAAQPPAFSPLEYCNGPLKPNTEYAVRVRAFTSLSPMLPKFSDSEPLIVMTLADGIIASSFASSNLFLTIILPILAALLLAALLAGLLLFVVRRRRQYGPFFGVKRARRARVRAADDKVSISESVQERTRPVKIGDFSEHVRIMSADSDFRFSEEYEDLKSVGKEQPSAAADLPCNRPKNRFTNILPYDHSRVKLQPTDDEEGTDYINASYMPGYNSPREFIVAQGPLHSTRDDFWRMIWEQNSLVIVMLTRCIEKGREKCDHYWPFDTEPVMYGDIQVTILNEIQTPDWTIREFRVCQGEHARFVRHFHFTAWPDFGVPEYPQVLVQFLRAFRERVASDVHPIVCHCSAGVGRSGTFIVLDRILQHLCKSKKRSIITGEQPVAAENNKDNGVMAAATYAAENPSTNTNNYDADANIDIFGIVHEMRRERCSMVQTEQQYVYIHHCVLCVLEGRENCIDYDDDAELHDKKNNNNNGGGGGGGKFATADRRNASFASSNNAAAASLRFPDAMHVPGYHQSLPRGYSSSRSSTMMNMSTNNNNNNGSGGGGAFGGQQQQQPPPPRYETMHRYTSQHSANTNSLARYGAGGGGRYGSNNAAAGDLSYNPRAATIQSVSYAGGGGGIALAQQQQNYPQRNNNGAGAGGGGGAAGAVGVLGHHDADGMVAADNLGFDDDEGIVESGPF